MNRMFSKNKDLVLVLGTVLILLILFSPIPPAMLDLAIIVNFGFGLTIMLLTFYVGNASAAPGGATSVFSPLAASTEVKLASVRLNAGVFTLATLLA